MNTETFAEVVYRNAHECVSWKGVAFRDCAELGAFLRGQTRARLQDPEVAIDRRRDLDEPALLGKGSEYLEKLMQREPSEPRTWEAGEALAEAWLTEEHGIVFPLHKQRDKSLARSTLPGPDLVGWVQTEEGLRLVVGEVKTSSDERSPPRVMSGLRGMEGQLARLAEDKDQDDALPLRILLSLRFTVADAHRQALSSCFTTYLNSEGRAFILLGLLICDTPASEADLSSLGHKLRTELAAPTTCQLTAIYLPWPLRQLIPRVTGRSAR